MSERLSRLEALIRSEIAECGPLPFSRFMELALYEPADGYYASGRASIGRGGDFFTSVSVGPVLGRMIAGQVVEMWQAMGEPRGFRIVEQGANDGRLAADILDALADTDLAAASYTIVEPLGTLHQRQRELLGKRTVDWVADADDLPEFDGIHLSNELFDALPFDIVESDGKAWRELRVAAAMDGFVFERAGAVEGPETRAAGFRREIRRGQETLLAKLAARMRSGFVLALDYGMTGTELLEPHLSDGTMACYHAHRRDTSPLECVGLKDITAHVDFSALARGAMDQGFEIAGYTDQHRFLVGASSAYLLSIDGRPPGPAELKTLRSLKMLLHPETMGTRFKALLLAKGTAAGTLPSGFRHQRPLDALLAP